jgi:hypothetical protein
MRKNDTWRRGDGGMAARVEWMAAATNLRMEGGRLQHMGKRGEGG